MQSQQLKRKVLEMSMDLYGARDYLNRAKNYSMSQIYILLDMPAWSLDFVWK